MSSKVDRLINQVVATVNEVTSTGVKSTVGNSTDNNRTASVAQTIRFLRQSVTNWTLGSDLSRVYRTLRNQGAFRKLRRNNSRTDAIDINELLTVVGRLNSTTKREVGKNVFYS